MNIVHLSTTPLAGSPYNISTVLDKYTKHTSRHILYRPIRLCTGNFSEILLKTKRFQKLFSVDRWFDQHDIEEYLSPANKLSRYGSTSVVLRFTFDEILNYTPKSYFDFIYIDAHAHTEQDNGQILSDWFPKLKDGDVFSGHDYEEIQWPKTFDAVNSFAAKHKLSIKEVSGDRNSQNSQDQWKSWYTIKNSA